MNPTYVYTDGIIPTCKDSYVDLQIQLDLHFDNKANILKDVACDVNEGFFFIDSKDGHCYLFDKSGNLDDVTKIKILDEKYIEKDIKKIVIPNSVTSIGAWAFSSCSRLMNVIIGNRIMGIGNYAFIYCTGITSVTIPDSMTNIGWQAFSCCEKMKSLIFKGKTLKQVKDMRYYPFGIEDESIIRCES